MFVYEKVRLYLEAHGLKQKSVAEAAGFQVNTFNAMMMGRRKMTAEDLRRVCLVLGVSADTFIK